jgi:protein-S-isoprenylcysteine O-methyltransferase Ste14
MDTMNEYRGQRSFGELISDLFAEMTTLMRNEAELARTEISDNVASIGRGVGMVVGGAVLLIPALVILLEAAVSGLAVGAGLPPYWSALIIGAIVLVIGAILLMSGINRMKTNHVVPRRTLHQLRQDVSTAREQVSQNHEPRRAA